MSTCQKCGCDTGLALAHRRPETCVAALRLELEAERRLQRATMHDAGTWRERAEKAEAQLKKEKRK